MLKLLRSLGRYKAINGTEFRLLDIAISGYEQAGSNPQNPESPEMFYVILKQGNGYPLPVSETTFRLIHARRMFPWWLAVAMGAAGAGYVATKIMAAQRG
jgi:hypothetical protein